MTLEALIEQQQQAMESLNNAKDKAWQDLRERHHALIQSFGGFDNLYDDQKAKITQEIDAFHKEWHTETGIHFKTARERHEQERHNLSQGKPLDSPISPATNTDKDIGKDKAYWQKRQAILSKMKADIERSRSNSRDKGRSM